MIYKSEMAPGPEHHEQLFYELISKPQPFTEEELATMRECLRNWNFNMARNHVVAKAQLRVAVETIDSIRRFDAASGKLMEAAKRLSENNLKLVVSTLAVAVVSLVVSAIALLK